MKTKIIIHKSLFLIAIIQFGLNANAQIKMGNNPQTIGESSLLELESTSKALVIPRMTTAQLAALATPVAGMMVYNTDSNCIAQRTSSAWKYLCATGGNSSPSSWQVTGNSGTNSGSNFLGTTNNTGLKIRTNNIVRMTVDSVGRVGIGTTNPSGTLHLVKDGAAGGDLRIDRFDNNATCDEVEFRKARGTSASPAIVQNIDYLGGIELWGHDGSSFILGAEIKGIVNGTPTSNSMPSAITFYTNPGSTAVTERMRITSAGNVGIGTTTPGGLLELSADQGRKPSTNTWTITSDERLKNIEGKYTKGLAEVMKLNPIIYYYKNTGKRTFDNSVLQNQNVGYSAQEIQKIFPEAVGTDPDGYLNFNMHSLLVAYGNAIKDLKLEQDDLRLELVSGFGKLQDTSDIQILTYVIKELRKENESLKNKILSCESSLADLKSANELFLVNFLKRLENIESSMQLTTKK